MDKEELHSKGFPDLLRQIADHLEKCYSGDEAILKCDFQFPREDVDEESLLSITTEALNQIQSAIRLRKLRLQQNEALLEFQTTDVSPQETEPKKKGKVIPSFVQQVEQWDDPHFDDLRLYLDKERKNRGTFVVEGRWSIERLFLSHRFPVQYVLFTPNHLEWIQTFLEKLDTPVDNLSTRSPDSLTPTHVDHAATKFYMMNDKSFRKLIGLESHRGVVAVALRPPPTPLDSILTSAPSSPSSLFVILERVANPENVGAICRSSLALGATAVLLAPSTSDPLYRKSLRASMGAVLSIPTIHMNPWPDSLKNLREAGVVILALTPAANAAPLGKVTHLLQHPESVFPEIPADVSHRLTSGRRVALLMGHEGEGVSKEATSQSDLAVRVEMFPSSADSLNVGSCTAVALYSISSALGLLC